MVELAVDHACRKLGHAAEHRKELVQLAVEHATNTLIQKGQDRVDHQKLVHEAVCHAAGCLGTASMAGKKKILTQLATEHACTALQGSSASWFSRHLKVEELGELISRLRGEPHAEGKHLHDVEPLVHLDVDHLVIELSHNHDHDHKTALLHPREGLWGGLESQHKRTVKEYAAWRGLHALAHDNHEGEHVEPLDDAFLTTDEIKLLLGRLLALGSRDSHTNAEVPTETLELLSHFDRDQLVAKLVALSPKHHHEKGFKRLLKKHIYSTLGLETLKKEGKKAMEKFARGWHARHG
jgi:hypothetical protein